MINKFCKLNSVNVLLHFSPKINPLFLFVQINFMSVRCIANNPKVSWQSDGEV